MDHAMSHSRDLRQIVQRMIFGTHQTIKNQPHTLFMVLNRLLHSIPMRSGFELKRRPFGTNAFHLPFRQHIALGHCVELVLDR